MSYKIRRCKTNQMEIMKKLSEISLILIFCLLGKFVEPLGASSTTLNNFEIQEFQSILSHPDEGLVKSFLEKGVDVNILLPGNVGLLPIAILCHSDIKFIENLIDRGININNIDDNGSTAICAAVVCAQQNPDFYNYYLEVVKILIKNGANLNIKLKDTHQTPLYLLCLNKDVNHFEQLIAVLLEAGADPNISDNKYNYTALHCAIQRNASLSIIKQLLAFGADLNIQGKPSTIKGGATALHLAIRQFADPSVIETLLKAGANPNALNSLEMTPLNVAIAAAKLNSNNQNTISTVKLLIEYGADTKAQHSTHGPILKIAEEVLGKMHPIVALLRKPFLK